MANKIRVKVKDIAIGAQSYSPYGKLPAAVNGPAGLKFAGGVGNSDIGSTGKNTPLNAVYTGTGTLKDSTGAKIAPFSVAVTKTLKKKIMPYRSTWDYTKSLADVLGFGSMETVSRTRATMDVIVNTLSYGLGNRIFRGDYVVVDDYNISIPDNSDANRLNWTVGYNTPIQGGVVNITRSATSYFKSAFRFDIVDVFNPWEREQFWFNPYEMTGDKGSNSGGFVTFRQRSPFVGINTGDSNSCTNLKFSVKPCYYNWNTKESYNHVLSGQIYINDIYRTSVYPNFQNMIRWMGFDHLERHKVPIYFICDIPNTFEKYTVAAGDPYNTFVTDLRLGENYQCGIIGNTLGTHEELLTDINPYWNYPASQFVTGGYDRLYLVGKIKAIAQDMILPWYTSVSLSAAQGIQSHGWFLYGGNMPQSFLISRDIYLTGGTSIEGIPAFQHAIEADSWSINIASWGAVNYKQSYGTTFSIGIGQNEIRATPLNYPNKDLPYMPRFYPTAEAV